MKFTTASQATLPKSTPTMKTHHGCCPLFPPSLNLNNPQCACRHAKHGVLHVQAIRAPVRPNPSLHPGPTTAGGVSLARASCSIITNQAYTACLRGPGELER